MSRRFRRAGLIVLLTVGACTIAPNSPLLTDGQLIDSTLLALVPLLPSGPDQAIANGLLTTVSANITALQNGSETGASFATVLESDLQNDVPALLAAVGASSPLISVLTALANLGLELGGETTAPAPAPTALAAAAGHPDPRPALQAFVAVHSKSFFQRTFGL